MSESQTNITSNHGFQNAKEVAQFCGKSEAWVYKHQDDLGVRKLGGSLFFPKKGELYELILQRRQGMEIRLSDEQGALHQSVLQNKNGSKTGRSKKKGRNKKSNPQNTVKDDPNRYGLLDVM